MLQLSRRHFISSAAAGASSLSILHAQQRRPNVILIITDDQGYGDLSLHGNPQLDTPSLDSIGKDGVQFTHFHVNPVCSPTRSSVMTGRYYYRTGVVDTFLGRSMMHNDEVTLAEVLKSAGYRTGLFGKWHLGDCYPLRSIDQGFEESLNCTGGGLTQPSDPPGNSYFDPMLRHNGKWEQHKGYCTDIFMNAALQFIEKHRARPFFAYIATNAPHNPLQIDKAYFEPFLKKGLSDNDARIYGMVKNIDENVGRLLAKLRDWKIEQDTIVIFMTDNGPQSKRYNGGMRGVKGTVYEGGIRVPFLFKWPRLFKPGSRVSQLAAHIDIMPTLLEACRVPKPSYVKFDGRSLMPLLQGRAASWQPRTLFFQWHRGDRPNPYQAAAAHDGRYKLVEGKELYDLQKDPAEVTDIAAQHPEIVKKLRTQYDAWFADVAATRNFEPPKIFIGDDHDPLVTLTRQDWRSAKAGWDASSVGHWEVDVRRAGTYGITVRMARTYDSGEFRLELNGTKVTQPISKDTQEVKLETIHFEKGPGQLKVEIEIGKQILGPQYVDIG
ncbi:MAG TPA: sulfatase-like hydrolase/transferase [Bryobacteraceae bacterium]|nr:sulfatase-like hydrolase/transferase [Bryobacteraceae bacterium]